MPMMVCEFGVTAIDAFKGAVTSDGWKVPPGTHQSFLAKGDRVLMLLYYNAETEADIKEMFASHNGAFDTVVEPLTIKHLDTSAVITDFGAPIEGFEGYEPWFDKDIVGGVYA